LKNRSYDDGVTMDNVLFEYERRLGEAQAGMAQARMHSTWAAVVLGIAFALFVTLGVLAIRRQIAVWWPAGPVVAGVWAGSLFRRHRQRAMVMWRIQGWSERGIGRMRGEWRGRGATGREFDDRDHAYGHDLGVFGDGSLFELLCSVRSGVGQRGLAKYLSEPPLIQETVARQTAVAEMRSRTELREKICLLGPHEFSDSKWETFREWMDAPAVVFPGALRAAVFVSSAIVGGVLLARLFGLIPWMTAIVWSGPLLVFQAAVWGMVRGRVKAMIEAVRVLSVEIHVVGDGIRLMEESRFESAKLRDLVERVRGAARRVNRLERLLNTLGERKKELFYAPSLVVMMGTQLVMAIEQWRVENREALRGWLEAFAEFEALSALGCYGHENPGNTVPEFVEGEVAIEAKGLGHPLIPVEGCVVNDFELGGGCEFYVISGSNMSGKSTLLRAIGLNVVLARAGASVRADMMRLSALTVCASIAVVDSLLQGKSKFMAEVERLRRAIELAAGSPVLFLIDEILSGTNSRDRRIAAEAVVRTLIKRGAIGAMSTHDLALTEIADQVGGRNVHMGAKANDPMEFDYRLKAGVTRESNALAIAKMAGVPV
jgi:hypothetical protein